MPHLTNSFLAMILAAGIAGTALTTAARSEPASDPKAPVTTRTDRTTAPREQREEMAKRRAALKQKRADCNRQARDQKLRLVQRRRFVRKCVAT